MNRRKLRVTIVTLKKRKTHFSHLSYWTAQRQRQGQRLKDAVEYRIARDFYHCCRWSNHHYSRGYLVRFYFNKIRFNNYIILSKQKRCIILFTYSFFFFFFFFFFFLFFFFFFFLFFFFFFFFFCRNEKGLLNFASERINVVYRINPVPCTAFEKHMLPFKLSNTTIYRPHTPA